MSDSEQQPLLQHSQETLRTFTSRSFFQIIPQSHHNLHIQGNQHFLQRFFISKTGHYSILLLVSLDVLCIFADFIITIVACESHSPRPDLHTALDTLSIASLVFSCLFMLELVASIYAFGIEYFYSKFHIFDSLVIVIGFIIDVLLRGTIEEVASLVVVLRLWRVFKIIEELSAGAQEQMEDLQERIAVLEKENDDLKDELREIQALRNSS